VSPTFQLTMCHKAAANIGDAYVALAALTPDKQKYRVQGWWKVPKGQCANLGQFQRPGLFFFAMANNGDVTWSDKEPALCVNANAAFDYTLDPNVGRNCGPAEDAVGFFLIKVDDKYNAITFTLQ
jgi:uncharacterized membrane protein